MSEEQAASLAEIQRLVAAFASHAPDYSAPSYNETQARSDFITPLLVGLGWDVHNRKLLPPSLREVVEEANVSVADDAPSRRPDYELRLARVRKLFVEAKKPSANLLNDAGAAFQARRYGYSAGMPIVVVTNFRQLIVYDCTVAPQPTDAAHVARIDTFSYMDYEARFNELCDYLARDTIYSGAFDEKYAHELSYRGSAPFDELFLEQVRRWRERVARDVYQSLPDLSAVQLTYAVQLFLSRLIFLRICEDRGLETYEQLKEVSRAGSLAPYKALLIRSDDFYDSGLFDPAGDSRLGAPIAESTLSSIIEELYYPESPYTFSVVQAEVLGKIYEQFLGEEITLERGAVRVTLRPEVSASGGVVPTPRDIADEIVDRTLYPLLVGRSPEDLAELTVLDMCCGSGIFLLSAYEKLCEHYLNWYINNGVEHHRGRQIMEIAGGNWRLTFAEKRLILLRHLRGVDIDPDAVEVAQLSLLLKLVEGESRADLEAFVATEREAALPNLRSVLRSGNSLVSRKEWRAFYGEPDPGAEQAIRPFTWEDEFAHEIARGGFSAIVGNPPYIRIQNMARYSPEEVEYYKNPASPYETAHGNNFDKYALFIERGIGLLSNEGRLGFIVPHKFMSTTAGRAVRCLVADRVSEILHFGSQSVFPGRSNYTAILVVGPASSSAVAFESVFSVSKWRHGQRLPEVAIARESFTCEPWRLVSDEFKELLDRLEAAGARRLKDLRADIFVGLQTSADDVYILDATTETATHITVHWGGRSWQIERDIVRPFLHDVQTEAFTQPAPNKWIIFPYRQENEVAHLIQPDEMRARFPGCWEYLTARREELEAPARNITGGRADEQQWYQFGRSQSLTKFTGPKIVHQILSLEPRYAYDTEEVMVTGGGNGPYYLVRSGDSSVPDALLLAVLNHPLAEAIVRSHTSVFRGGYYSHGKQFIEDVLVPSIDDGQLSALVRFVAAVTEARRAGRAALTPAEHATAERRFDAAHADLMAFLDACFGLTKDDLRVIDSVPSP